MEDNKTDIDIFSAIRIEGDYHAEIRDAFIERFGWDNYYSGIELSADTLRITGVYMTPRHRMPWCTDEQPSWRMVWRAIKHLLGGW